MRLKLFLGRKGNTTCSTDRKTKKKAVLVSCRQQQKGEDLFLQLYLGQNHPLSLWRADTMEHLGLVWTLECSGCLFKLSVPIKAAARFESLQHEQQQSPISQVSFGVNTIKTSSFSEMQMGGVGGLVGKNLTSGFISESDVSGGRKSKNVYSVLSFLNWIESNCQDWFLFFAPARTPSWLFNSSHCKCMKHWWELSCSNAYATAIMGHDQQDLSFPAGRGP